MALILEIFMALAFVATSGLLFNKKYSRNFLVIGTASILGILSTVLVVDSVREYLMGLPSDTTALATSPLNKYSGEERVEPFTREELYNIVDRTFANVCRTSCIICSTENDACDLQSDRVKILKLPLLSSSLDKNAYLIEFEENKYCGSAGCPSMILIINSDGSFAIAHEDWGISDETAMLIAREAILRPLR